MSAALEIVRNTAHGKWRINPDLSRGLEAKTLARLDSVWPVPEGRAGVPPASQRSHNFLCSGTSWSLFCAWLSRGLLIVQRAAGSSRF